jgi:hypothetical protein
MNGGPANRHLRSSQVVATSGVLSDTGAVAGRGVEVVSPQLRAGAQVIQKPYYRKRYSFPPALVEHYSRRRTEPVADLYDFYDEPEEEFERPRDSKIDEAKEVLMRDLFGVQPERVFYGRQIEVMFERVFFHWITSAALSELIDEGKILSQKLDIRAGLEARFYWSRQVRYWKREATRIAKLIERYSREDVGRALGQHGELMFDAALPRFGFMPVAWNVNEHQGKRWMLTDHNLDRVFTRDSVAYGAEIKNTLDYIDREELDIKLEMCKDLGLRPLFIMRFAPKSYNDMIIKAGGYAMIFEWQLYPPGLEALVRDLRQQLGLKVDCPKSLAEGTIQRFLTWHLKQLGGGVKA